MKPNIERTFFNRIRKQKNGCWHFVGALNKGGYGVLGFYGSLYMAHRFSFLIHNGYLPSQLLICHKCDNRKCVNPKHLFMGTHQDNATDRDNKGRGNIQGILGVHAGNTKVTESIVKRIRASKASRKDLGIKYNISQPALSQIINRKSWKYVK